ncbi:MAG TPA: hypothetical protein VMF06_05550 [Candidatus Limnocylindria bacterium]|jgi:hypothetical protein|nr:hypothetical protein [Candidatus Limnocylindria bacterium]
MTQLVERWMRPLVLFAITLLYLMVWGFAGIGKVIDGRPPWFAEKFGPTFLGRFPGVAASFWWLTLMELLAFALAAMALLRFEFLRQPAAPWLKGSLTISLFVFLQLGFGLWLTNDFNGGFQQFVYFGLTLVAIQYVQRTPQVG